MDDNEEGYCLFHEQLETLTAYLDNGKTLIDNSMERAIRVSAIGKIVEKVGDSSFYTEANMMISINYMLKRYCK